MRLPRLPVLASLLLLLPALAGCLPEESDSAGSAGGSAGPTCTATYQGPASTSDWDFGCSDIYEQRCKDGNTSMADDNCRYALTSDEAAACRYCPAPAPPPSSPTLSTSCNGSGVALYCTASTPFSCDASNTCYSSYSACTASSECGP